MERIKQALDRARHDRHSVTGYQSSGSSMTNQDHLGVGLKPVYSTTRVVPVAPSVLRRNKLIHGIEDNNIVTSYKMLSTQVIQRLQEHGWNSLAIVSANTGEGKTLTAINLAISIARAVDKTVLLADLNLHDPRVASYFEYTPEKGISDYLIEGTPLDEIFFNPAIDGLVVLPGNQPVSHSAELLASTRMAQLVEELKARYPSRIVLFDLPPLLSTADALAFSPFVESALLVVEEGRTLESDVTYALDLLKITNVLGTVLNRKENSREVSRK